MEISSAWIFYFITACGNTETHVDKCLSSYEDKFVHANKEINWLKIWYFLHECLPIIDDHSKKRIFLLIWRENGMSGAIGFVY